MIHFFTFELQCLDCSYTVYTHMYLSILMYIGYDYFEVGQLRSVRQFTPTGSMYIDQAILTETHLTSMAISNLPMYKK